MAEKWYETPDVSRDTNSDKCLKPVLIISGNSFAPNYLPSFTWKLNSTGCNWFFVNGLFFTTLKWDNAVTMPGIWGHKTIPLRDPPVRAFQLPKLWSRLTSSAEFDQRPKKHGCPHGNDMRPWSILTIWLMVIPSIIFGSKNNGYYKSLWTIGWLKRWILVETIDGDSFHGKWYVDPSIWKIIWEWYKDRKKKHQIYPNIWLWV